MDFLGRVGAILIAVIAVITGSIGLVVFGPLVLMVLVPVLLIAGTIWILRQYRNRDKQHFSVK